MSLGQIKVKENTFLSFFPPILDSNGWQNLGHFHQIVLQYLSSGVFFFKKSSMTNHFLYTATEIVTTQNQVSGLQNTWKNAGLKL